MQSSQSPAISFRVAAFDTPRVFISYRWGKHDDWVSQFASVLIERGIEVIHDRTLRISCPKLSTSDFLVHLMKNLQSCHVFIPIFTPEYLMRIGYREGKELADEPIEDGFVYDEYQAALLLGSRREIETVAVLREGSFEHLPEPFTQNNTLDMRSPSNYEANISILCHHLLFYRAIKQK